LRCCFFLVVCAVAAIQMRDLLSSIMLLGIYSFIMAVVWTRLNAVDVAFTEASVGAGDHAILLIAAPQPDAAHGNKAVCAAGPIMLIYGTVILLTSAVLLYGTLDHAYEWRPGAPAHKPRGSALSGEIF
jgi:multicomponent Na+:H+ antiporter subunit B